MRQEALSLLRKLTRTLSDYARTPAGAYVAAELRHLVEKRNGEEHERYEHEGLKALTYQLKQLAPHCCVCPYCKAAARTGKKCRECPCCHGMDWTPAKLFDKTSALPSEYLEAVMAMVPERSKA